MTATILHVGVELHREAPAPLAAIVYDGLLHE
jgi:hypothetical protein